jgi:hypothetical protein
MDGINPTLAFAVLFFGLTGNAREAPDDPATEVHLDGAGCPALTIAVDPSRPPAIETWDPAFWSSAADTSRVPDVIEPNWSYAAPVGNDDAVAMASADPVIRQVVPAGINGTAATPEDDPCKPAR